MNPIDACKAQILELVEQVDGLGGLISINANGEVGMDFNTPRMAWAYSQHLGTVHCGINTKDPF